MLILSLVIAVQFIAATPAVPAKPAPLTDEEARTIAGVITSIAMVEGRLYREMTLHDPGYRQHITKALDLMKAVGPPLLESEPSCPPGSCSEDSVCIPCYPPLCDFITLNGRIRELKTNMMKIEKGNLVFRREQKKVVTLAQELVKLVGGTKALSQAGYRPEGGIFVPSR